MAAFNVWAVSRWISFDESLLSNQKPGDAFFCERSCINAKILCSNYKRWALSWQLIMWEILK